VHWLKLPFSWNGDEFSPDWFQVSRKCARDAADLSQILAIYNESIATSTAIYSEEPLSREDS